MRYSFLSSLACVVLIVFFVAGCATMDADRIQGLENTAVPIVYVHGSIDYSDVQSGALAEQDSYADLAKEASGAVQQAVDDDSFDLVEVVNDLRDRVYNEYGSLLGVNLIDEDRVVHNNQAYQDLYFEMDEYNWQSIVTPEGYKPYRADKTHMIGDDRQQRLLEAMPQGTDSMLMASATYAMRDVTPSYVSWIPFYPTQGGLEATVNLTMVNLRGETVLDISESALSDETVSLVGTFTLGAEQIEPMAIDATNQAMDRLGKRIQSEL